MENQSICKVLGVDPGAVRVGLALSDELQMTCRPLCVLDRKKPDPAGRVVEIAVREKAKIIVVGLPLNSDGSEGSSAIKARWFAERLKMKASSFGIEVLLWDERYSSAEASALQHEAGTWRKTKGIVDDWAAALILQNWLDAHSMSHK